jgi:hypothetical protein
VKAMLASLSILPEGCIPHLTRLQSLLQHQSILATILEELSNGPVVKQLQDKDDCLFETAPADCCSTYGMPIPKTSLISEAWKLMESTKREIYLDGEAKGFSST